MSSRRILQAVDKLLGENPSLPIPIESIVIAQGIHLVPYELGDEASGILVLEKDKSTIGYNAGESPLRNRFTIAHELGHYMLHREGQLFVDKDLRYTLNRPPAGTPSSEKREWEANEFAACILMPEHLVKRELAKVVVGDDEQAVQNLAKIFNVSQLAMSIRIARLGLG